MQQEILTDLSADALTAAIEDNGLELSRAFGRSPYINMHEEEGLTWFVTGLRFPTFNGVSRTQLSAEEAGDRVARMIQYFRVRALPMHWMVSASSRPLNLEEMLEEHGLSLANRRAAMAIDLARVADQQPEPAGLEIRPVVDDPDFEAWFHVFASGFELPAFIVRAFADIYTWCREQRLPLHHHVAWLEGEPVACSTLFLAAGVAGVHNVVTLPQARRRGIGTAITLAPLRWARQLGYHAAVLFSSQRGHDLYLRLGFREYFQERAYFWDGHAPLP